MEYRRNTNRALREAAPYLHKGPKEIRDELYRLGRARLLSPHVKTKTTKVARRTLAEEVTDIDEKLTLLGCRLYLATEKAAAALREIPGYAHESHANIRLVLDTAVMLVKDDTSAEAAAESRARPKAKKRSKKTSKRRLHEVSGPDAIRRLLKNNPMSGGEIIKVLTPKGYTAQGVYTNLCTFLRKGEVKRSKKGGVYTLLEKRVPKTAESNGASAH
jgi:hypothetical protein